MKAGTSTLISGSCSGSIGSPRSSATASSRMRAYGSKPTAATAPVLALAQQLARAADLEIVRRDLEAGAELGEPLQHREPLPSPRA